VRSPGWSAHRDLRQHLAFPAGERAAAAHGVPARPEGAAPAVVTVDGLLTGLHEPRSSHLLMLGAFSGAGQLRRCYEVAVGRRYLWHEFGDVHLLLP
jgi:S-adenosylmethionine:tRNA ribosyltransferase-isomerase